MNHEAVIYIRMLLHRKGLLKVHGKCIYEKLYEFQPFVAPK